MIAADPSRVEDICAVPSGINEYLWQYEHLRQFIVELNLLIVPMINDRSCTSETCPKMKATDMWLYLCASHAKPQDCSAIDYMIHSIDHATSTLNDPKNFKSRLDINQSSQKYLQSIVRRLYRLFSHTYFHHEQVFMDFERSRNSCERFTVFAKTFKMMSSDLFIIPEDAFLK